MARPSDENWKLTPYEIQRKPQEIFIGDIESAVTPKSLHKELMCPICLAILKKTMTTKECLHRFCADCIITALRSGNKECPTCRKKLISKRSLRPDKNFDLLISEIYPNLDQYEAEHDESIARLNLSYMQTLTENVDSNDANRSHKSKKITEPNRNDNEKRMRKRRKYLSISQQLSHLNQDNNCEHDSSLPSNTDNTATNKASVSREVELTFEPHPESELMRDDKSRYIKTTAAATVDHLRKYLTMRLNLDRDLNSSIESDDVIHLTTNNISIYIAQSSDHLITLNGSETLEQLADNFGKSNQPLNMYYLITKV